MTNKRKDKGSSTRKSTSPTPSQPSHPEQAPPPANPPQTTPSANPRLSLSSECGAAPCSCCHVIIFLLVLLFFLAIIVLAIYFIYRPSMPAFDINGFTTCELHITNSYPPSTAAAISSNMQFDVLLRNPNRLAAVVFNRLVVYAAYRNQPITLQDNMSRSVLKQGGELMLVVRVESSNTAMPVTAEVAEWLEVDKANGAVGLELVMTGLLKYKVGPFSSGWAPVNVRCNVQVDVRGLPGSGEQQPSLVGQPYCSVDK